MTTDPSNQAEAPKTTNEEPASQSANDWQKFQWELQEKRERERETLLNERANLLTLLRANGIERMEAEYHGYSDSGNVEEVTVYPETASVGSLGERLMNFVWAVAYNLHPGFEINEGGRGTLTWNLLADRIDVDHAEFFTDSNQSYHEDV